MLKITSKKIIQYCHAILLCSLTTSAAFASPEQPEAGFDYRVLTNNTTSTTQNQQGQQKIEIVEFFNYACGHCYAFEPHLKKWLEKNKQNIVFKRTPVGFNQTYEKLQKLYYTFELMGTLNVVHDKIFNSIHKEGNSFANNDDITKFANKNSLDAKQILSIYHSFSVATKAQQATKLAEAYQINGVPNIMVAGKYVTSSEMMGSRENVLKVMDYLLKINMNKVATTNATTNTSAIKNSRK